MSTMQNDSSACVPAAAAIPARRSGWDIWELVVGYSLVLLVIWTPNPERRWFYWGALAWFAVSLYFSYPGRKELGFHTAGFCRSLWVVGVAMIMAAAAIMLASSLHTLHHPHGFLPWVMTFGGYALWSFLQQFLMQGYFLLRLLRVLPNQTWAAITTAGIFATAHLPNPVLTPMTLIWGVAACLVFLRFRNIFVLGMAHAIFGICVAITFPAPVVHNMRVGLGYLRYQAPMAVQRNQRDHKVSTVAWERAEAPTRRSVRHALP
jgi:hypothetical protein